MNDQPNHYQAPPAGPQPADGAERWNQVQELLLGDHRRSTESQFGELRNQLAAEGERLGMLYMGLERRHVDLVQALKAEVAKREALEQVVHKLSKSHVSREDLASRLRLLADHLQHEGE
ncbi:MAG: hypothetical protein H6830_05230 [Planctomycetes bacterium]|nr:hypothetical protein [Planctomycetota bacterium]MCB9909225.1 hypothetical protein [Planctomycetota bacterium]MCB9913293.1 hypothetical protein [Planctomycetota bacterium]